MDARRGGRPGPGGGPERDRRARAEPGFGRARRRALGSTLQARGQAYRRAARSRARSRANADDGRRRCTREPRRAGGVVDPLLDAQDQGGAERRAAACGRGATRAPCRAFGRGRQRVLARRRLLALGAPNGRPRRRPHRAAAASGRGCSARDARAASPGVRRRELQARRRRGARSLRRGEPQAHQDRRPHPRVGARRRGSRERDDALRRLHGEHLARARSRDGGRAAR